MLLQSLPNPARFIDGPRPRPAENIVLNVCSDGHYYYPEHSTPLMLITNFGGRGNYMVNDKRASITGKSFYLLNPDDRLSIRYSQNQPVKTLFILFNETFAADALSAFCNNTAELLEQTKLKEVTMNSGVPFFIDDEVSSIFTSIIATSHKQGYTDQKLYGLLKKILTLACEKNIAINKIGAIKKSTREELYQRLYVARNYIHDNAFKHCLSLDEIAQVACLNKFHMIDNFKVLFGMPPHRYLVEVRLNKALELLRTKKFAVNEVCQQVGFESVPTFSLLFKRRFGKAPSGIDKA